MECIIDDERWSALAPESLADQCLAAVAAKVKDPALARITTVLFTEDEAVRALNAEWRGKDRPTNVLSFPAELMPGLPDDAQPLGDLALAYDTTAKEAGEKRISLKDHACHLMVHGLLHLLGYDHIDDADAEVMEALEREVLEHLGIADPYRDYPPVL
ncbi:MAG: rRNA maturation RNase YbeY [Parvularculaceae bacterium]|nr:rRNA maturation RNase YbeY [Parvularculaceae bacterium]